MAGANANFNVRMPAETKMELDEIAQRVDRSRNWVINEAVKQYLEVQREQIAEIERRVAEIENGQAIFIPHDEVVKRQRARLQAKLGLI